MIKKLALIIGFIICLSSCGKDYVYRIEGELSNLEDQTVYAVFEKDNYKVLVRNPGSSRSIKMKRDSIV